MYIEKIKINKFRVLEDVEVRFQPPSGKSADPETGNVVNVIAGVNGSGKTSVLNFIGRSNNLKDSGDGISVPVIERGLRLREFEDSDYSKNPVVSVTDGNEIYWHYSEKELGERVVEKRVIFFPFGAFFVGDKNNFLNTRDVIGEAEEIIASFVIHEQMTNTEKPASESLWDAISTFNEFFCGVSFSTKLKTIAYSYGKNKPVFENLNGEEVSLRDLSHGEKVLYLQVLAILKLNLKNSVVLLDEPDVSMHPAWQQRLAEVYRRIGSNNQFIVATHSPQIIASVPYQNRIILHKQDGKIEPLYMNQPPVGIDINSILAEVMGVEPVLSEVLELRQKYRNLIESGQEHSEEAIQIKSRLLTYEGRHSRFMQEMDFLIELRDAA